MEKENLEDLKLQVELLTNAKAELQAELTQTNLELSESKKKETESINRAMKVHEENSMIKSSEEIATLKARLDYDLMLSAQFAKLKNIDPSTAYVTIKAGEEMGLSPVVSMNMLYTINGTIKPYGDKMLGYILSKGYKVKYIDETKESVTVVIYNDHEEYKETARMSDTIIQNSLRKKASAAQFAPKNKLRFHAIRMIASFHLPHLFMGISDEFTADYQDFRAGAVRKDQKGNEFVDVEHTEVVDLAAGLNEAENIEQLNEFYIENKQSITRDIKALSLYGKLLGRFENQENQDNESE
jgi:hypothetical protein